MKQYAYKIGAVFYILWGLLHIVGAASLLFMAQNGAAGPLAAIGSATPAANIPQLGLGLTSSILAYYAWNLLWVGFFVVIVAMIMNWKNSPTGYWLNLAVVSAVDIGLILLLLIPGYMAWSDGLMGIVLWIPAVFFSTIGLLDSRGRQNQQVSLS